MKYFTLFWQFIIITLLVFIGFYKTLNFSFHANREIGWLIGITGGDFSLINLIKSHGFISLFNYKFYGPNPAGWYLTGIIFHILATFLLIIFVNNLTKNKAIGFLTGLWFGVSLAWHDVITFGSQEAMYAVQLSLFLVSLFFYKRFREKIQTKFSYFVSLMVLLLTLPLRELGLIFFPILFFFDYLMYFSWARRKTFLKFFIPQIPFILLAIAYFIFVKTVGEAPHYFADERVKLQYALISQKRYLEYLMISLASFGTYLPPQIIPYPFLNIIRDVFTTLFSADFVKVYFFSFLGYLYYFMLIFITYLKRNSAKFKLYVFSLIMIGVPTFFYSFSVTMSKGFFLRDYSYDENRWRYFAFVGTSLFLILFFYEFLQKKKFKKNFSLLIMIIFVGNLILNISLLWKEQDQMYEDMFKSQKLFYKTFQETFPTYANDTILYSYPYSYQLGDYLWEWYSLKEFYYPNLSSIRRDWNYGEMEKVLALLKDDPSALSQTRFIDFDPQSGVRDHTQKAQEVIRNKKTVDFNLERQLPAFATLSLPIEDISPVEIPYVAEITMKADLAQFSLINFDEKKLQALIQYAKSNMEMRKRKVESVCRTRGNMLMFDPGHLVDGNFGNRSLWWADCMPGLLILDLGKEYSLSGFMMGGVKDDPLSPRSYFYEVSTDNKNWTRVFEVKDNTKWEVIDKWPQAVNARYVRVGVSATQNGSFAILDEAEPVLESAADIFNFWESRENLTRDLYKLQIYDSSLPFSFARFGWKTNLTNIPSDQTSFYFPFTIDGEYHIYKLPIYESENYSLPGQFLKRKIQKIDLDFGDFPGIITINNIKLAPKIPIIE